jgi:hypothetical protein
MNLFNAFISKTLFHLIAQLRKEAACIAAACGAQGSSLRSLAEPIGCGKRKTGSLRPGGLVLHQ